MSSLIYISLAVILQLLICNVTLAKLKTDYPEPPAIFEANEFTKWKALKSGSSRRADVNVPFTNKDNEADNIHLYRLDLVGDAATRGYDFGALMANEIREFINTALPNYFKSMLPGKINTDKLPEALQKLLDHATTEKLADFAWKAMWWVYQNELEYMPKEYVTEMEQMAVGMCSRLGPSCNVTEWDQAIKTVNMLPELVRMACTAYGAWGDANVNNPSGSGGLVQVRALDFGNGPFVNYTIVATYRDNDNSADPIFTTVTFPGMVGSITGMSDKGVAISEKVWMTSGTKKDLQPGNYHGIPDVFMLRHVLQNAKTKEEAIQYAQDAKRTWAIFMGVGDFTSQKFNLVAYSQDAAVPYDDTNIGQVTSMPYIKDVCYVDQHPQPSTDPSLPQALNDFYGEISQENSRQVVQYHKTGDVHIAVYDYKARSFLLSIGRVNGDGAYHPDGMDDSTSDGRDYWMAYNRPYVRFQLDDLAVGN